MKREQLLSAGRGLCVCVCACVDVGVCVHARTCRWGWAAGSKHRGLVLQIIHLALLQARCWYLRICASPVRLQESMTH